MKNKRMSLKRALEIVDKDYFYSLFRDVNNTIDDIASKLNISKTMVNTLSKYWDIKWTPEEISIKKSIAAKKIDFEESISLRNETNLKKYGTKNPRTILSPESYVYSKDTIKQAQEKYINTCLEKYGKERYNQTEEFKKRIAKSYKNTCIKKYGVNHVMQIKEIKDKVIKNGRHKYSYNGILFDSSWELAIWIYAKDHNEEIIRTPIALEYYVDNILHHYYPDFLYKGELIEVKGNQFLDENNHLINSYLKENLAEEISEKEKCMIRNNVILYNEENVKPFLDYITNTYGKNYLKKFINK